MLHVNGDGPGQRAAAGRRHHGRVEDAWRRQDLSAGFDEAAEAYQRTRPVCPPQLFDDLVGLAGLRSGDRVAEIGCGTGQATVPLAERGMTVTAVEPGGNLAAVARRRLAGFPSADVLATSFEDWQPRRGCFDAVVAVNSLHWVDPRFRYSKPSGLLRPGAAMVVAGCQWARPPDAERFWTDVQQDYQAVGYPGDPPPPPGQIGAPHLPAEAAAFFEEVACLRYPFQIRYSAEDYLANLATQSGTRSLSPARRADFLSRVAGRLNFLGSPRLTATFVGYLTVGRRRGSARR